MIDLLIWASLALTLLVGVNRLRAQTRPIKLRHTDRS